MTKYILALVLVLQLSSCGYQAIPQANNQIDASWAEVLNQYQRRSDLIPNLVSVVKGYATHERETLEKVVQARAAATQIKMDPNDLSEANIAKIEKAQSSLGGALSRLMVVAEQYPNLKANENFRDLQSQLEGTENRITVARNRYIASVQEFNNLITVFPSSLTNSLFFHYTKKPQFTVANEAEAAKAPEVKF